MSYTCILPWPYIMLSSTNECLRNLPSWMGKTVHKANTHRSSRFTGWKNERLIFMSRPIMTDSWWKIAIKMLLNDVWEYWPLLFPRKYLSPCTCLLMKMIACTLWISIRSCSIVNLYDCIICPSHQTHGGSVYSNGYLNMRHPYTVQNKKGQMLKI